MLVTLYSCKIPNVCAQDKERGGGGEMEGKKSVRENHSNRANNSSC